MPKSKLSKKSVNASTQQYLDIAEIRDDVVILKDGSLRAVLLVSSINFALKSEDEQNAIVQGYMSFLNSLDFELQIVVQSRRLSIDKYLNFMEQKENEQTNDLLRTQIFEYRQFINQLVTLGDIMGKRFYVIVPFSYTKARARNFFSQLGAILSPSKVIKLSDSVFKKYSSSLSVRVDKISSGLAGIGLSSVQLNTQSLIELYYQCYNIDLSYSQKIPKSELLQLEE
jgi:hypothetical protein